jgi:Tol biopolymer transport system component
MARLILALTTTALVVAAASPDRAHASFPGENGRFLFIVTGLAPLPSTVPPLDPVEDDFFFGNRLATANKRGRDVRLLPTCIECEQLPGDWSPNGRRIVYAEDEAGVDVRLVTTRPDGTKRKAVYRARRGILSSPVWSPNGRRIAFVWHRYARRGRGSDIYVIRRDGTHLTRVTRTGRNVENLDWSSRNRLVFHRSTGKRSAERRYEIFTIRPDGVGLRRLTHNNVPDGHPDWAPGGRTLTFVRNGHIWTMTASGARQRKVASRGHSPVWAPDGSSVAFVSRTNGGAIHTVKPSGENETVIGQPGGGNLIAYLDWQPRFGVPLTGRGGS